MRRKSQMLLRRAGLPCIRLNLKGVKQISPLPEYSSHPIFVISREHYNTPALNCNRDGIDDPIILYLVDSHFYLVKSANSLLGKEGRLCLKCFKFIKNRVRIHRFGL